jgi:hypothetical protein
MGGAVSRLGRRRRASGREADRSRGGGEAAARLLRLFHQRRQGARPGRRHGAPEAAERPIGNFTLSAPPYSGRPPLVIARESGRSSTP